MAFVITRLCRDCVDGACVSVCPADCIVQHVAEPGEPALPNQLYIDPDPCIDCGLCAPECPWEAIYPDSDVPAALHDDIALNALASARSRGFDVPVEHLARRTGPQHLPEPAEIEANRQRWGLSRGAA
jgi:NAD-dependent dihydropyrimidine dehydrogenase PreA subunit